MKHLWAPWRLQYVEHAAEAQGCIFCDKPTQQRDQDNLIIHRGERVFTMMNAFPYNSGHLMVAPYRHVADLTDLDDQEMSELMAAAAQALKILRRTSSPQGFNLGINVGEVAGAGIAEHIHLHIVPRWQGDTNYMLIMSDTRVVPEALADGYRKLRAAIEAEGEEG